LCIGNREGGDDAVGPWIADQLSKCHLPHLIVIDAGILPENFTGVVKQYNPDSLILIDAIEMNLSPGDVRIVPPEKIGLIHISTHGIPLSVLIKYFHQHIKHIILIGIQPHVMQGAMTKQVRDGAERVVNAIVSHTFHKMINLS
jgi:hydrogenase 3 maturation protease